MAMVQILKHALMLTNVPFVIPQQWKLLVKSDIHSVVLYIYSIPRYLAKTEIKYQ